MQYFEDLTSNLTERKRFLLIALRLACLVLSLHVMWEGFRVWVYYGFFSLPSLYSTLVNTMIFSLALYIFNDFEKFIRVIGISIFLLFLPYILLQETSKFVGLEMISDSLHQYQAYSTRSTAEYDIVDTPIYGPYGIEYDQEIVYHSSLVAREVLKLQSEENREYEQVLQDRYEVVLSERFIFWQSALIKGYSLNKKKNYSFSDLLFSPLAYFVDVLNDIMPLMLIILIIHALTFVNRYLDFLI